MTQWEYFQGFLDYTKSHYDAFRTWTDEEKLQEAVETIEKEIQRLRDKKIIK